MSEHAGAGEDARPAASPDELRLSRRAAMKAAVGGAVTAGVFVAPRVEGFSLVPDYAAAASGDDAEDVDIINTTTSQAPSGGALCGIQCCVTCWNAMGLSTACARTTCVCGTHKSCGDSVNNRLDGLLTVNKNSPPGSSINLAYSVWGPTEGCSNQTPTMNLTINGIVPPHQSCDISVNGVCSTGTFSGGMPTTTFNADAPISAISPQCTGSVLMPPGVPAQSRCFAPATLTITLACTFT